MQTVKKLIEELQKFPLDAVCHAYEGEVTGVVVREAVATIHPNGGYGKRELGYIPCSGDGQQEDEAEVRDVMADIKAETANWERRQFAR